MESSATFIYFATGIISFTLEMIGKLSENSFICIFHSQILFFICEDEWVPSILLILDKS
jgi:hypothetical protein